MVRRYCFCNFWRGFLGALPVVTLLLTDTPSAEASTLLSTSGGTLAFTMRTKARHIDDPTNDGWGVAHSVT